MWDGWWSEVGFAGRVLVVAGLTAALGAWYGTGLKYLPVWAMVRAGVQLGVVALLLRGVLTVPWTAAAFVVLMLSTASLTSMGRIGELWRGRVAAVVGVTSGSIVALAAVLGLGLVDVEARYVVAIAGIVIGNTMSAATLTGRNFLRATRARSDEVEAWLSLGARPPAAHAEMSREAVRETLIPTLDQSKSTGLVTLPGAFVGALFGGASPLEAAKFQLTVLVAIALGMTITAIAVATWASRTPFVANLREPGQRAAR